MGRRLTLDEFLKAFTDEKTESVTEAITVRVSDAEVRSLGQLFIQLMGGVAQCLRRPPDKRRRGRCPSGRNERRDADRIADLTETVSKDEDDLIH